MERLVAYWELKNTVRGVILEVQLRGRSFQLPPVEPQAVGHQITVVRDLLFALGVQEFSLNG